MRLHLVGGFLGSGKTTAIANACKLLLGQGYRAGVVTNDQGKYLVDTAFFQLNELPAVEVGGGCFCCNYSDLEAQLDELVAAARPAVIFAESVGSCADLVATVLKPLLELRRGPYQPASFSVFADARLLRLRLNGAELPFSEDVVYIYDQQIAETNLLVVNKMDLLAADQRVDLLAQAKARWPEKVILAQTSLTPAGVQPWLVRIESGETGLPGQSLAIDYQRYGAGEQRLAWLDMQVRIDCEQAGALAAAQSLLETFSHQVETRRLAVGHAKFVFSGSGGGRVKVSLPVLAQDDPADIGALAGGGLDVLANLRVELPAAELRTWFEQVLDRAARKAGGCWSVQVVSAFNPGFPQPQHRC